ncbi:hypothetical protein EDC04DRAFT_2571344 [Pisolithus marmoratus]|nr:hypothetical protein EDC04DRAFT_2571344 [Pisolithus marmoratus]
MQAYRHVFTSPNSIDQELKAMQSSNVCFHGMQMVIKASVAYITIQVSNYVSKVFKQETDLIADSKKFYNSILELLEDPNETDEVDQLMG